MIQSHVVHFKRTTELSQLQVNVTHIHFQPVCIVKHPVSCDDLVSVESFRIHLIVGILVRQIEEYLQRTQFVISGFHCDVDENCALQGYYAASNANPLPTFQGHVLIPS
jgi:hypothetical protein